MSKESTYDKPTVFGFLALALGAGIIIGMMVGKTYLKEDIARAYMVANCQRSEDINSKFYRCEY